MKTKIKQSLIQSLNDCATACNFCASACLAEKEVHMLTDCIRIDIDCADICTLTASLLSRESKHAVHLLRECAEVCGKCATECEKHAAKMDHCMECAKICRECEMACKVA